MHLAVPFSSWQFGVTLFTEETSTVVDRDLANCDHWFESHSKPNWGWLPNLHSTLPLLCGGFALEDITPAPGLVKPIKVLSSSLSAIGLELRPKSIQTCQPKRTVFWPFLENFHIGEQNSFEYYLLHEDRLSKVFETSACESFHLATGSYPLIYFF